jgi:hypothetical protein
LTSPSNRFINNKTTPIYAFEIINDGERQALNTEIAQK